MPSNSSVAGSGTGVAGGAAENTRALPMVKFDPSRSASLLAANSVRPLPSCRRRMC